jgi:hypothetical protein
MKKLFLCILAVISFTSCQKETLPETEHFLNAQVDNTEWLATSVSAHYSVSGKTFGVSGIRMDPKYYREEWIRLNFSPAEIDQSGNVRNFAAEFWDMVGGDVIAESFSASSAEQGNMLTISRIDPVNRILEGEFVLRLKHDSRETTAGSYLVVQKGKFRVIYTDAP